jgi:MFS family permease
VRARGLLGIASVQFVAALGLSVALAMAPALMRSLGLSASQMAVVVAIYFTAALAGIAVLVPVSRHWGRKPVLVGASLLAAEGLVALAGAGDVPMLVVARLASGFAVGAAVVAAAALHDAIEDPTARRRGAAIEAGGGVLGLIAGPALALMLSQRGAGSVALTAALLAAAGLLAVLLMPPEAAPPPRPRRSREERRGRQGGRRHGGRPQTA